MAYGPETHTGHIEYEVIVEHVPSQIRLQIRVDPFKTDGSTPSESTRDQVFQAFLNKLAELPNAQVISATKEGNFSTPVTSP